MFLAGCGVIRPKLGVLHVTSRPFDPRPVQRSRSFLDDVSLSPVLIMYEPELPRHFFDWGRS